MREVRRGHWPWWLRSAAFGVFWGVCMTVGLALTGDHRPWLPRLAFCMVMGFLLGVYLNWWKPRRSHAR